VNAAEPALRTSETNSGEPATLPEPRTSATKNGEPMAFERQAVSIYAAINGYLNGVAVERVPEFEEKLLAFLDANAPEIAESIKRAQDIAPQTEEELKTQLKKFTESHQDLFANNK